MPHTATTGVLIEDSARRERAKARLYVLFQLGGWGFFYALQILYTQALGDDDVHRDPIRNAALNLMIVAMGLLLTHYTRPFMERRGWKQLGWRGLGPRIAAASLVLSLVWCSVGYGFTHGLLREPIPAKYDPVLIFSLSCLNGSLLMFAWFCLYFFYHTFDRYNRSEIARLALSTSVKEAELRALKSQVNPHFIFNSLNSLRALIDEDPARARQAVTQLANLLRYSLQSGQLETVPFEDELQTVNDYLALEQVRHEERLQLRLDIAPETLALPVPPMLLQTLVENAVKYGIGPRAEGGEVSVVARMEGGTLRLQVANPGSLRAAPRGRGNVSTGVGLRNAAERLRLIFGERATLSLREQPAGRVVAEVSIHHREARREKASPVPAATATG
ncbi:MAG TPA: histidine kinase [Opitutus sp.]|nr:histidine kinase [Opitutus sp.]